MDLGIYASMMVFAVGFRELVKQARASAEWLGTLTFGAAIVWLSVTLVADGLEAGAALDAVSGAADPSAVRALVLGRFGVRVRRRFAHDWRRGGRREDQTPLSR